MGSVRAFRAVLGLDKARVPAGSHVPGVTVKRLVRLTIAVDDSEPGCCSRECGYVFIGEREDEEPFATCALNPEGYGELTQGENSLWNRATWCLSAELGERESDGS